MLVIEFCRQSSCFSTELQPKILTVQMASVDISNWSLTDQERSGLLCCPVPLAEAGWWQRLLLLLLGGGRRRDVAGRGGGGHVTVRHETAAACPKRSPWNAAEGEGGCRKGGWEADLPQPEKGERQEKSCQENRIESCRLIPCRLVLGCAGSRAGPGTLFPCQTIAVQYVFLCCRELH